MRRFASLVLTVALVFSAAVVWAQLPTAPPEQVGLSSARLGRLGTVFKTEIEQDKLPGAVVVVARKGKIAFFESFGHRDKASGTRMTNGLGFAVREAPGVAGLPGSAGEYMWAGFAGTYFWVDPKEELVGVLMTQAPSATRAYYRRLLKQLVYQAIVD